VEVRACHARGSAGPERSHPEFSLQSQGRGELVARMVVVGNS
jgi:hypothetical protein